MTRSESKKSLPDQGWGVGRQNLGERIQELETPQVMPEQIIMGTYQQNQWSILRHEYKQQLLVWHQDVLVYKHVQEHWQFLCHRRLNQVPHLARKFVPLHSTNNSDFQWVNDQCPQMKLHDPTNKKGYNPGTLLVIEKLTGEKDCNGSGAERSTC